MSETLPVFLQDVDARKKATSRRAWIIAGVGVLVLLLCIFNLPQKDVVTIWKEYTAYSSPFKAARNRTLGFATIYAITTNTTWRVQGMNAAANLTGIDIEFYPPREVPEEEVHEFRTSLEGHEIGRGKALAWLAHLDMIQHIVDEGLETALIIEDDVDWDVYVREQMFQVAQAFGSRQAALKGEKKPTAVEGDAEHPYGMEWELLWIGHNFEDMTGLEDREQYMWHDTTVPSREQYIGFTPWFDRIPQGHRGLLGALGPVSTYAYALTADGAKKLAKAAAALGDVPEAFDVRLAGICRDRVLECMIVAPELMHHHVLPEKDGFVASESVLADDGHDHGSDGETVDAVSVGMGTTDNVVNSARCRALFNSTCLTGQEVE